MIEPSNVPTGRKLALGRALIFLLGRVLLWPPALAILVLHYVCSVGDLGYHLAVVSGRGHRFWLVKWGSAISFRIAMMRLCRWAFRVGDFWFVFWGNRDEDLFAALDGLVCLDGWLKMRGSPVPEDGGRNG